MTDIGAQSAGVALPASPHRLSLGRYLAGMQRRAVSNWVTALGFLFASSVVGVAVSFALFKGISVANLTRDPAAVLGGAAYIGFVSNIGIALWIAAAASALTAGFLATRLDAAPATCRFLYATGALSLLLGLDDLFLLHEDILPRIGVPQKLVLAAYASLAVGYALVFLRQILTGATTLFVLAGFFLVASLAIDFVFPYSELEAAIEDGAKLFGITFWFLFVVNEVVNQVVPTVDRPTGV